ncbi:MAG TPA: zinc ribbon domain-containing protein [Xanthobacteraceae bacterium]|nr:zinc ribbon domain-containing protein [Xanthobacteraceae bacterium]
MTRGFTIFRCRNCGAALFPERLLCPRCHGADFAPERRDRGTVEEISTIRHMIGQTDWKPRVIANVRVAEDLHITVGLLDSSGPGDTIDLYEKAGAPFGVAHGASLPS